MVLIGAHLKPQLTRRTLHLQNIYRSKINSGVYHHNGLTFRLSPSDDWGRRPEKRDNSHVLIWISSAFGAPPFGAIILSVGKLIAR